MLKNLGSFILFYISYIPLFLILMIKNLNFIINSKSTIIIFSIIGASYIFACIVLSLTIRSLKKGTPRNLTIGSLTNKNNEILNYLFVYILPFISLEINRMLDVISFLFLFILIAYISIKNGNLHINPVLNIVFRYNVYSFQDNKGLEKIILTKKDELEISEHKNIKLVNFHKNIYLDIN